MTEEVLSGNRWEDDPAFRNLFIGVVAEFSSIAIVKKPKAYFKLSKGQRINDIWFTSEPTFSQMNLAQSIYKPL